MDGVCIGPNCTPTACTGSGCVDGHCVSTPCQDSGCIGYDCDDSGNCWGPDCVSWGCIGVDCVNGVCTGPDCREVRCSGDYCSNGVCSPGCESEDNDCEAQEADICTEFVSSTLVTPASTYSTRVTSVCQTITACDATPASTTTTTTTSTAPSDGISIATATEEYNLPTATDDATYSSIVSQLEAAKSSVVAALSAATPFPSGASRVIAVLSFPGKMSPGSQSSQGYVVVPSADNSCQFVCANLRGVLAWTFAGEPPIPATALLSYLPVYFDAGTCGDANSNITLSEESGSVGMYWDTSLCIETLSNLFLYSIC